MDNNPHGWCCLCGPDSEVGDKALRKRVSVLKARVERLENFVRYYGRLTLDEVTDREIAGNLQSKAREIAPPVGEKEKS